VRVPHTPQRKKTGTEREQIKTDDDRETEGEYRVAVTPSMQSRMIFN